MELLPPGLREVSDWLPDSDVTPRQHTHEWIMYGGIARTR
jgi:S-adenosyl methyltransferase